MDQSKLTVEFVKARLLNEHSPKRKVSISNDTTVENLDTTEVTAEVNLPIIGTVSQVEVVSHMRLVMVIILLN